MDVTRTSLVERQIALIEHYLNRLDDMNEMYAQGHEWAQEALRSFDQEWQQFQAQQRWAVGMAPRDKRAAQLVVSFPERASKLLMQVEPQAALAWFDDALVWVGAKDLETRYHLLRRSRIIWRYRGNTQRIGEILEDLEALADQMDDHRRADVAQMKVEYYDMIEDYEAELFWSERALALALPLEDEKLIAEAYYQLGGACIRLHQASRAERYLKMSLDFYRELGSRYDESFILDHLALNAYNSGNSDEAVSYCEQGLVIIRELGERRRELNQLGNLAIFLSSAGDLEKALLYGRQAWAAAVDAGMLSAQHNALGALLSTLQMLGLMDELYVYLERARVHLRANPSPWLQSQVEHLSADIAAEEGDWATACQIAKTLVISDRIQRLLEREYVSTLMWGQSLSELGQFDGAATVLSAYLQTGNPNSENPLWHASVISALSYAEVQRGNGEEAQSLLNKFFTLLDDDGILRMDRGFLTLWNAYRTCIALNESRVSFLMEQFEKLLQLYLGYFHDDDLRVSFLRQSAIQYLIAARSQP